MNIGKFIHYSQEINVGSRCRLLARGVNSTAEQTCRLPPPVVDEQCELLLSPKGARRGAPRGTVPHVADSLDGNAVAGGQLLGQLASAVAAHIGQGRSQAIDVPCSLEK